ncbi:MAG: hypothetical protein EOO01_12730 [Chitinophagaceae bacterium]|nr:MAG: hypothetical protein EOO01_12730 [Chitinophagaceae bacterium]
MKKILVITVLFAVFFQSSVAQIRQVPRRTIGRINNQALNLLDDPKFRKAPIAFVPLQPDVRRGYDPEKVYTWTDPTNPRKKYSAKGKEILAQVNEVEKSLNDRGHTLREKKPFIQLNLALPNTAKNDFSKCVITNRVDRSRVAMRNPGDRPTPGIPTNRPSYNKRRIGTRRLADVVYAYTGYVTTAREHKSGTLSNTYYFERKGSGVYADIMMSIPASTYSRINSSTVELSETEDGTPVTSVPINIKSPRDAVNINESFPVEFVDCERPNVGSGSFPLNIYNVNFSAVGYSFPESGTKPKYYYTNIKFFDAAGNEINTYQPNTIILNNQKPMPINVDLAGKKQYTGFNYELLDPGLHAFGFYVNSGGFTSAYSKSKKGYDGIEKSASLNGDMSMGVKYFNFKHLVNSDEPISEEFVVFGYKINSERNFSKGDGAPPRITIKGINRDPDYGVITLMNEEIDLRTTTQNKFEKTIDRPLLDFRFFIGPIPCAINVNVTGKASIQVDYESVSGPTCDMKTNITPHADVNLNASGGVDAFSIAYAKVVAGINLLTFDMPYSLEASAETTKAEINPSLTVGGLSGQIYFQAGLCIPIPFVDDICTDFRVDILNWNGLEKSFKIDPAKGIVL